MELDNSEEKYLKYKNKYLKFKQSGGLFGSSSNSESKYVYFCFNKDAVNTLITATNLMNNVPIAFIDTYLSIKSIKYNFGDQFNLVIAPVTIGKKSYDNNKLKPFDNLYINNTIDKLSIGMPENLITILNFLQDLIKKNFEEISDNLKSVASVIPVAPLAPVAPVAQVTPSVTGAEQVASTEATVEAVTIPDIYNGIIKICDVLFYDYNRKDDNMILLSHYSINDGIATHVASNSKFNIRAKNINAKKK
jgi:hypothetical protein